METKTFSVPNISCGHCLMTIKSELMELNGVIKVEGSSLNKQITVEWDPPATLAAIQDKLKEINYPAS